jgi:signal transduction histidine kinase/CheY-like chemotaxis protein
VTDKRLETAVVRWFSEFADHGIFTTDEQLVVTGWNRWLERMSGRSAADVVGRPLAALYPDLAERGLIQHYHEAVNGHAFLVSHLLHGYLLPIRSRIGAEPFATMPQRAQIAPLVAGDEIIGTITVIDDVSERVASEQLLRRQIHAQEAARASAEAALRVKDDFLATLSHEIRTPLNAVLGWTRILRDHRLDPDLVARGIAVIDRNTALQTRMIDDLLDTARIMAGKLRLEMQAVDLVPVAIAALDVVLPSAHARGITITRALDPNVGRVLGDPERLQQVLWNLLSNAVKFTPPGGNVDFRLDQAGRCTRMTVTDTGRGISAEFLPFVFDRFRQGDASSSRREGGLGLGLALVKELVNLHGGSIHVESAGPDQGSRFTVELPALAGVDADGGPARQAREGPRSLKGVHVLVVEDDEDARELIVAALTQHEAVVTAVASVAAAAAVFATGDPAARPHVIVADIGLPGEDGYQLLRRLRGDDLRGRLVPAVAVSGFAAAENHDLARAAGYRAYLEKPVDVDELLDAVLRAIRADV